MTKKVCVLNSCLLILCVEFTKEARDIIHISIVEKHSIENFVLELNSLKYAFNTTFADCKEDLLMMLMIRFGDYFAYFVG